MSQLITGSLRSVLCSSSAVQPLWVPGHHCFETRALPAATCYLQGHIDHQDTKQQRQHLRIVTACSQQRKRNPFIDIQRDVLPDGKPNTPWRRLKLQIQQALSIQALIRIYTNNRHKNNVWRPIHSAGIIMRIGALQYYRVLQNPISDQQTSVHTLDLLNRLAPDLTDPKVLYVLDAARLSQVIVVLSTLNPRPELAVVGPLVQEVMREGHKKLPKTKPDLLAELAAALVRLGCWEKELWLAVVAAAKAMLLVQQQSLEMQEQHEHQLPVSHAAKGEAVAAVMQQGQDLDEDDYVGWAEQGWKHRQKQQQQGVLVEEFPARQKQQQQWQGSDGSWQDDQQQLALASSTEFQWEEQQQLEEQQEWLEEQYWYDPDGQQQQHFEDDDLSSLHDPWHLQQDQAQPQQRQQQMLDLLEDDALDQQLLRVGSSSLFGPRWLSADFPKLAAALAAVVSEEDSEGPRKDNPSSSTDSSGVLGLRASIEEVMEMMGSAAARLLVLLTPTELADLAEAYATVGLCHNEVSHGIHKTLIDKIEYMTSSFSSYRPMKQQQLANGNDIAAAGVKTDLTAVIRAAWSLSESGHADLGLVAAVQKLLSHCLRSISSSRDRSVSGQLDNGLHLGGAAAAAAGVGAVQLVQMLQLLVFTGCSSNASVSPLARFVCSSIASSGLDALTPQQLQSAAVSLVELQQQPEAAAAAAVIGAAAAARAAECGGEVLIEVLWGCVMLGCGSELLAELAVAFVDHQRSRTLAGPQQRQRQKKSKVAAAAAGLGDAFQVNTGLDVQHSTHNGVVLSSKSQAQLVWALQQLNRQDLLDRVLAGIYTTGTVAVKNTSSSTETHVPVF